MYLWLIMSLYWAAVVHRAGSSALRGPGHHTLGTVLDLLCQGNLNEICPCRFPWLAIRSAIAQSLRAIFLAVWIAIRWVMLKLTPPVAQG